MTEINEMFKHLRRRARKARLARRLLAAQVVVEEVAIAGRDAAEA